MKKFYLAVLCTLMFTAFSFSLSAQTFTPFYNTPLTPRSNGFYEYLPQGYASGSATYPLIIAIHGNGDVGNGNNSDLPKLLLVGLTKLINDGNFPNSFTVNSTTKSFIVIAPQFTSLSEPLDIGTILDYAIQHYRVDINRVYITGLSLGGALTWEFAGSNSQNANRIAAIVPIAGANFPIDAVANTIAAANLPVWATHNSGDPIAPVSYTDSYVQKINSAVPATTVPAKKTIFVSNSHDAWTQTYDPAFTDNGMNVYQWMLQFSRSLAVTPVVLESYKLAKTGERQVTVSWTTALEKENAFFTLERSADGRQFSRIASIQPHPSQNYAVTDDQPLPGENYYRLSQTDRDGKTTVFDILRIRMDVSTTVFLYPNPASGTLNLQVGHEEIGPLTVSLLSAAGHVVKTWKFDKTSFGFSTVLPLQGAVPGSYFLRLDGKSFRETTRVVLR